LRSTRIEVDPVARASPWHTDDPARARQCDVGSLQVRPAKADIGADGIGHGEELDKPAIRCNHVDATQDQRGHADVAVALHGQRIIRRVTGRARQVTPAILVRRLFADDARRNDIESPQMTGACLGNIDRLLVGR
jgi:hypothetical protein